MTIILIICMILLIGILIGFIVMFVRDLRANATIWVNEDNEVYLELNDEDILDKCTYVKAKIERYNSRK